MDISGATPSRARRGDVVMASVVFVVLATGSAIDLEPGGRDPDLVGYLLLLVIGLSLLARRQRPVLVLLVSMVTLIGYYALDFPAVGLALPVAAAMYSVAESGRLRWAIGSAIVLVIFATGYRLVVGGDSGALLTYQTAVDVTLIAAVLALGDSVHSRRRWYAELWQRTERAERERAAEAARRIEAERVHIARELHDVLGHTVSLIALQAGVAVESVHDDPAAAETALQTIRHTSRAALDELRKTLDILRDPDSGAPLDPVRGLAHLDRVVAAAAGGGLAVDVRIKGAAVPLPVVVDAAALRIVQESITNVVRHAGASSATVELRYAPNELTVRISDDGRATHMVSAAATGSAGYGIRGMRERVGVLGGTLSAGAEPNGGFLVAAKLPLRSGS